MDIQTVTVAYNGIKFAKEAFSYLLQQKIDVEVRDKVSEAMQRLGQSQDTLFELREQLFTMQSAIQDLKSQIDDQKNWNEIMSKYTLVSTEKGGMVYRSISEPIHHICPSCINKHQIQFLQDDNNLAGTFSCPGCKAGFPFKHVRWNV